MGCSTRRRRHLLQDRRVRGPRQRCDVHSGSALSNHGLDRQVAQPSEATDQQSKVAG